MLLARILQSVRHGLRASGLRTQCQLRFCFAQYFLEQQICVRVRTGLLLFSVGAVLCLRVIWCGTHREIGNKHLMVVIIGVWRHNAFRPGGNGVGNFVTCALRGLNTQQEEEFFTSKVKSMNQWFSGAPSQFVFEERASLLTESLQSGEALLLESDQFVSLITGRPSTAMRRALRVSQPHAVATGHSHPSFMSATGRSQLLVVPITLPLPTSVATSPFVFLARFMLQRTTSVSYDGPR